MTHEEFQFERVTEAQGHYEYQWELFERTNTPADPETEDPTEPGTENPAEPDGDPSDTQPSDTQPSETQPSEPIRPAVSTAGLTPNRPSARSRAVPALDRRGALR